MLVDTRVDFTLISQETFNQIKNPPQLLNANLKLYTVNGTNLT